MSEALSLVDQPESEPLSELIGLLTDDALLSDLSRVFNADIAQDLGEPLIYVIHVSSFLFPLIGGGWDRHGGNRTGFSIGTKPVVSIPEGPQSTSFGLAEEAEGTEGAADRHIDEDALGHVDHLHSGRAEKAMSCVDGLSRELAETSPLRLA